MTDEELKALVDKWSARIDVTEPYSYHVEVEELLGDFQKVAQAFTEYRRFIREEVLISSGEYYRRQREKLEQPLTAVIPLEDMAKDWKRIDEYSLMRYSPNGVWEWQVIQSLQDKKWYWCVAERQTGIQVYASANGYPTWEDAAHNYTPTWKGV